MTMRVGLLEGFEVIVDEPANAAVFETIGREHIGLEYAKTWLPEQLQATGIRVSLQRTVDAWQAEQDQDGP